MAENSTPPAASLQITDILFTLFRHKWKILFFTLAGFGAAAGVYYFKPPVYTSDAKLLIRYVTDSRELDASSETEITRSPDTRGTSVINDEIEILVSYDALIEAARRAGPNKILAAYGGGTNDVAAARLLNKNLKVEPGRNSGVISVSLGHKDPEIAQRALRHLVQEYLERHVEIHKASGAFDFLQAQTDQVRLSLQTVEEQLRREKNKVNVISLEEAKSGYVEMLSSLRQAIKGAEAEIAERKAQVDQFASLLPAQDGTNTSTSATLAQYKPIAEKLFALKARESDMTITYAETSRAVQAVRKQIEAAEQALRDMGVDPSVALAAIAAAAPKTGGSAFNVEAEKSRIVALEAKIKVLNEQLEETAAEARKLDNAELSIVTLQRKKELAEDLYLYFSKNLERARIDQAVDSGKINNISVVQDPTMAIQDFKKLYKMMAMAFAACLAAGLGLAFASDFFLDQSFKRPKEVESVLRVPLLVSIPHFGINGHSKLKAKGKLKKAAANGEVALVNGEIAPWDENDPMLPYYEALRDRVVMSYAGDLHKPKIVGLTSCARKAGVSRVASGLAASLSRDVERNVLLIGLQRDKVSVSAFAKGRPASLENGHHAANGTDSESGVEENLQALTTRERHTSGASIVQTFSDLMPKLRASDYDYIIFDLPPLTQTSGSLRLAAQMERTLLVIEAEETSKETVKRAKSLLTGARANVMAVLNKTRSYGPQSIQTDI